MLNPEFIDGQVYVATRDYEEQQRRTTVRREGRDRDTKGKERHIALSHAVISSDVQGLAALLDAAKLHSNNSERVARYLLGLD